MIALRIEGLGNLGDTWAPVVMGNQMVIPYTPEAKVNPNVYVVPGAPQSCIDNPMLRECDQYTDLVHYQYALPSGTPPNANIQTIAPGAALPVSPNAVVNQSSSSVQQVSGNGNTDTSQQGASRNPTSAIQHRLPVRDTTIVQPAPLTPSNTGNNNTSPGSVNNLVPGPSVNDSSPGNYQTAAPYVNEGISWLEQTVAIGNFDIPIWMLGVVGVGGLVIFSKSRGSSK